MSNKLIFALPHDQSLALHKRIAKEYPGKSPLSIKEVENGKLSTEDKLQILCAMSRANTGTK